MSDPTPAEFDIAPPHRGWASPVSLVWLVPFVALVIALGIAWQSYSSRGPVIEIAFENAEGVSEGSTQLRYRNVNVGEVESVRFSSDLSQVIVGVRVNKDIAPFIDSEAEFWIVRPQVTARGITGLETVLSGVFIEGSWDSTPGGSLGLFTGLTRAPLVSGGQEGTEFIVRAPDGGRLQAGAPIVYKGIHVGFVDQPELTEAGDAVTSRAFVQAPYDQHMTTTTRFWDSSGATVDIGFNGISVNIASIASLIEGGLSFDTIGSGGRPIETDHVYNIFETEDDARSSAFLDFGNQGFPFSILFDESVSGLAAGASVEFRGLRVGTVTGLSGTVIGEGDDRRVSLRADISLQPIRLGLFEDARDVDIIEYVEQSVANGMRARLASEGLLGGKLKIEFVEAPDAEPASLDRDFEPSPLIPSIASEMPDVAASAQGIMRRIDNLPIEQLIDSTTNMMAGLEKVISSEKTLEIPGAVADLVRSVQEKVAALPITEISESLEETLQTLKDLTGQFDDEEAINSLMATLDRADDIAASVQESAARLPDLVTQLSDLATKTTALQIEPLLTEARTLLETAQGFVGSDALAAIPTSINSAITDAAIAAENVRTVTDSFLSSNALAPLLDALARTDKIAASIEATSAGLPELLTEIQTLAATANGLPLDQLVASASDVLGSADAVIGSDAVAQIPAALSTALADMTNAVADVQTVTDRVANSPAIDTLLAALERTDRIAASVETTTQGLPDLIQNVETLAATASELPLDDLVASATDVLEDASAIVGTPEAAQLPASLNAALAELSAAVSDVQTITAQVTASGAVDALLASIERTDQITVSIEDAAAELPGLVAQINALAAKADSLPLEDLVASADSLVKSADALVSSDDTAQIPAALASSLDQLSMALAELRAGGAIENTNRALASASAAAEAIESAMADLPALTARIDTLAAQAQTVLSAYGERSEFNTQTVGALRDLRDAARAITSLARTIERKPNSLLIGR